MMKYKFIKTSLVIAVVVVVIVLETQWNPMNYKCNNIVIIQVNVNISWTLLGIRYVRVHLSNVLVAHHCFPMKLITFLIYIRVLIKLYRCRIHQLNHFRIGAPEAARHAYYAMVLLCSRLSKCVFITGYIKDIAAYGTVHSNSNFLKIPWYFYALQIS